MRRRDFVLGAMALGCTVAAPAAVAPGAAPTRPTARPRFQPTRFSVQVTGTGPDVILIPGLTSGRHVWASSVRAVPGYRYHLIQVSGFAGEPVRGNRDGVVIAPLAAEIARYIADRGLQRPAVVGHSMGGTLGMMLGADHPNLVGRLMVVDMLPQPAGLIGGTSTSLGPFGDRLRGMLGTPGGRRVLGSLMSAFSPPDTGERTSDPDLVGRALHDLARIDMTNRLAAIRAPLTIVYGAPDPQARAAIERTFTSAYGRARGARLVRIDGAGHMVMLDQPTRFNAALRDFLRG